MLRWLKILLFTLIPTLLLLAALEVLATRELARTLRPSIPVPSTHGEQVCFRPSLTLTVEPIPGACGFNAEGLMSASTGPKVVGKRRVLLIGDSVAQGFDQGQALIDAARAAGLGEIEVWNAGVPGYDTCNEAAMLEERGWPIEPDVVFVVFCVNDFARSEMIRRADDGGLILSTEEGMWHLPGWASHSRGLLWLALRYRQRVEPTLDLQGESFQGCLERMSAQAKERQVPLIPVLFPLLSDANAPAPGLEEEMLKAERRAREILTQRGGSWLDLRPALETHAPLVQLRENAPDPIHPSTQGEALTAQALVKVMPAP